MKSMSSAEFRADPAAAIQRAHDEGAIAITDNAGKPRAVLAFPEPPRCDLCEGAVIARVKGVCGGRPTLVGRRLTPADVIGRLESGEKPAAIQADFGLQPEQMRLVLELWRDMRRALRMVGWSKKRRAQ